MSSTSKGVATSSTYTNFVTYTVAKKLNAFFFILTMFIASVIVSLTAPNLLNLPLCVGLVA
eukprot:16427296-Heterocapsa_arctica.AAC.1